MKRAFVFVVVLASAVACGCAQLNSVQRAEYQAMRAQGLAIEEKKPAVAAALGLLPGGGSFYTRQWGLGVADLLLWPLSICWDPVAGYWGAEAINYDMSRAYVRRLREKDLSDLQRQLEDQAISQAEYIERRRSIDQRYDFD